jgi:hypothetical protein
VSKRGISQEWWYDESLRLRLLAILPSTPSKAVADTTLVVVVVVVVVVMVVAKVGAGAKVKGVEWRLEEFL